MTQILIVDDDENSACMLSTLLRAEGFKITQAASLQEARQQMLLRRPRIVLLDIELPDGSGLDLFSDAELRGNAEIVLITGHASVETSVQALRVGAADYLTKPINVTHLMRVLGRLAQPSDPRNELLDQNQDLEASGRFGHLWGRAASMRKVYDAITRVTPTAVNVLIVGESGTGKELVAQTVHDFSRRRKAPFLGVNCGAISPQLIESELFGHEKGSFTGAMRQHLGFFERAHGGTLFLDEVTEMPVELQVKLLRVLESGSFMRVGSEELIETDVRIIAATNRSPIEAVAKGKLREDLYYRLNVFQISLPPLRERLGDIKLIAGHFLNLLNASEGAKRCFSEEAYARLRQYHWPGNVRELRNVVQRSAIMADGEIIQQPPLPDEVVSQATKNPEPLDPNSFVIRMGTPLAEVERKLILRTLEHCGGLKERTADMLGISLKTLYNRLREYERADESS